MASLPNIHPFMVHFPVALFTTAFVCDVVLLLGLRQGWFDRAAVLLYGVAAVASAGAAISGKLAANELAASIGEVGGESGGQSVNAAVALHGDWAFFAVVVMFIVAGLRLEATWRDRFEPGATAHRARLLAFAAAMLGQWVLVQTAGRGGELVYRYGVGRNGAIEDHAIIPNGGTQQ